MERKESLTVVNGFREFFEGEVLQVFIDRAVQFVQILVRFCVSFACNILDLLDLTFVDLLSYFEARNFFCPE